MDPLSYIYIAVGSAFLGSMITGIYNKLNGNGKQAELVRLSTKLEKLEQDVTNIKELLNKVLVECIRREEVRS